MTRLTTNRSASIGWQPIKNAPRDGSWFIALQDGAVVYPCSWYVEDNEGGWYDHINQSYETPTVWFPLVLPEADSMEGFSNVG